MLKDCDFVIVICSLMQRSRIAFTLTLATAVVNEIQWQVKKSEWKNTEIWKANGKRRWTSTRVKAQDTRASPNSLEDTRAIPDSLEDTRASPNSLEDTRASPNSLEDTRASPNSLEDTRA